MFAIRSTVPLFLRAPHCGWVTHFENSNRISSKQVAKIFQSDPNDIGSLVQRRKGHVSWRINFGSESIFLKHYFPRNFLNRLTYVFRDHRAKRECETYRRLNQLGLPTAEIYLYSDQTVFKLWKQSCLVFRYYADYASLSSVVASGDTDMLHDLVKLIAKLHDCGVQYGDLHAGNILVQRTVDQWKFLLIDMDKVTFHQNISISDCVDDLARLNAFVDVSDRQRLRFLLEYAKLRRQNNTRELCSKIHCQTINIWKRRAKRQPSVLV